MAEIIGRMTCPVCGEPLQDVKINKNNKLYMYCDRGCMIRLNAKQSNQALPVLRQRKTARLNRLLIVPVVDCGNFANDDDDIFN